MTSLWMLPLALLGCGDKEGPSDSAAGLGCFAEEPSVRIGSGESTFEDVASGDGLTMVHGPQGGWHMLASIWVENVDQIVEIEFTITVKSTGAVVSDNSYRVALVTDGECAGYFPGMYGYLSVGDIADGELDTPPELLSYETMVLAMTVTDAEGRTATTELEVLAEPDPVDVVSSDSGTPS
ncbi:MAG: hypothetical protein P8R54_25905 [Myxococcota bacterium]|nr:hypothetical protein [Myxococcota bacterium]